MPLSKVQKEKMARVVQRALEHVVTEAAALDVVEALDAEGFVAHVRIKHPKPFKLQL